MSVLALPEIATMDRLWVNIPADGIGLSPVEQTRVLPRGARLQVMPFDNENVRCL